jgi:hypothetical protein
MLLLPRGAHIEIEYNPRRPSIRTIVRQVKALGYWVVVRPRDYQPFWQDINTHAYLLLIYPPPFDPQWNEDVIAGERFQQVNCDSVEVEVTQDLFNIDGIATYPIFKDPASDFYGVNAIQYQGEIIYWLKREYGEHVQVGYTLYEEYLEAHTQGHHSYPTHRASLSDLLLLNRVIKRIVHDEAWYLPENPEFSYGCLIRIWGTSVYFDIQEHHYECRWRRRHL